MSFVRWGIVFYNRKADKKLVTLFVAVNYANAQNYCRRR